MVKSNRTKTGIGLQFEDLYGKRVGICPTITNQGLVLGLGLLPPEGVSLEEFAVPPIGLDREHALWLARQLSEWADTGQMPG